MLLPSAELEKIVAAPQQRTRTVLGLCGAVSRTKNFRARLQNPLRARRKAPRRLGTGPHPSCGAHAWSRGMTVAPGLRTDGPGGFRRTQKTAPIPQAEPPLAPLVRQREHSTQN